MARNSKRRAATKRRPMVVVDDEKMEAFRRSVRESMKQVMETMRAVGKRMEEVSGQMVCRIREREATDGR